MHELRSVDKADSNDKILSSQKAPRNDLHQSYLFPLTLHRIYIDAVYYQTKKLTEEACGR